MLTADVMESLSNAGWRKSVGFCQKEHAVQALIYEAVICMRQSSIDQFYEGLETTVNLLKIIRQYPDLMKPLFTTDNSELTYVK